MSVDTRKSRFASAVGAEAGLIVGFITVVTFFSVGKTWMVNLENLPWLAIMFIWLFGVMVWCAFGVVRHAEALAERFGEPYGTLILTISVIRYRSDNHGYGHAQW